MDFERELCKGFGFVNFTALEHLERFIDKFDGRQLLASSSKVCQVALSKCQGLRANILRYRNSPVMGDEVPERFKPALFVDGQLLPFPAPSGKGSSALPRGAP